MEDSAIVELFFARDEAAIRHTAEKYGKRLRALACTECRVKTTLFRLRSRLREHLEKEGYTL